MTPFSRAVAMLALFVSVAPAQPAAPKPLTQTDVLKLVELQLDEAAIVGRIEKAGLAFAADDAALGQFAKAGAPSGVLAALRKAGAEPGKKAISYDDVLALYRLGLENDAVLKRLAQSPTVFVLDAGQVAELKRAGASDAVLAAMQGGRPAPAGKLTDLAIVLDCSGSMSARTGDGRTKMEVARAVVADLIAKLPAGLRVTFIIYGHDAELVCKAVKVVRGLAPLDEAGRQEMIDVVRGLKPAGHTPIALAARVAGAQLARQADAACGLILITDGMETCHEDPAAEMARLARTLNLSFGLHVVGFDVKAEEREMVEQIAKAGKGTYHAAGNAAKLAEIVGTVQREIVEKVQVPAEEIAIARPRVAQVEIEQPDVRFPELEEVFVIQADKGRHPSFIWRKDVLDSVTGYGKAMALTTDRKYDVYARFKGNKTVLLLKDFAPDRKLVKLNPQDYLGLVRVEADETLPAAKGYFAADAGVKPGDWLTPGSLHQDVAPEQKEMVLPVGAYSLWLARADEKPRLLLADKVEVKAGKAVVLK